VFYELNVNVFVCFHHVIWRMFSLFSQYKHAIKTVLQRRSMHTTWTSRLYRYGWKLTVSLMAGLVQCVVPITSTTSAARRNSMASFRSFALCWKTWYIVHTQQTGKRILLPLLLLLLLLLLPLQCVSKRPTVFVNNFGIICQPIFISVGDVHHRQFAQRRFTIKLS